ncbi:unnamed protein product [Protopolystoma xenopodis]|uniref:Uncharacterized protein n=1 Tax=Protopolystoma xenopodis TaxID=117903 RepID=A0A3S5FEB0_9PLAT|nr:unnamed protein product [Protopolystoma xenopodis]
MINYKDSIATVRALSSIALNPVQLKDNKINIHSEKNLARRNTSHTFNRRIFVSQQLAQRPYISSDSLSQELNPLSAGSPKIDIPFHVETSVLHQEYSSVSLSTDASKNKTKVSEDEFNSPLVLGSSTVYRDIQRLGDVPQATKFLPSDTNASQLRSSDLSYGLCDATVQSRKPRALDHDNNKNHLSILSIAEDVKFFNKAIKGKDSSVVSLSSLEPYETIVPVEENVSTECPFNVSEDPKLYGGNCEAVGDKLGQKDLTHRTDWTCDEEILDSPGGCGPSLPLLDPTGDLEHFVLKPAPQVRVVVSFPYLSLIFVCLI